MRVVGVRASWGGYYVSVNASCADDRNLKIVRCSTFQGRCNPDFWGVPKNPLSRHFFSTGLYYVFRISDSHSEGFFFTVLEKLLNKVESRIQTEQKSTMEMRPLGESAASRRKCKGKQSNFSVDVTTSGHPKL